MTIDLYLVSILTGIFFSIGLLGGFAAFMAYQLKHM